MSRLKQFKLPDLGEGLTEGEILKWLVAPGDTVTLNQPIVEVETAKAAVEVPSPYAGVVTELLHGEGETVDVGSPIITVDTEPGGEPLTPPALEPVAGQQAAGAAANPAESVASAVDRESVVAAPADDEAVEPGLIGGPAPGGRTSVLVGYGPRSVVAQRRPRKAPVAAAGTAAAPVATPTPPARVSAAAVGQRAATRVGEVTVLAKPPVRKMARDLGVDLRAVPGTGPNGTITRSDVESAAGAATTPAATPVARAAPEPTDRAGAPTTGTGTGTGDGAREQRIPVKGVRKHTAAAMVASAFTAPHVTEFVTIDVTATMELRTRLAALPEFSGVKVSPLLLVARALISAVRRHPMINSSWDDAAQEIVVKDYVNLGIAAATPRGLVVPNVKDAGRLTLVQLAQALQSLTDTARAGRTTPEDMSGGTITITNVGVFGVDTGTPILNPGESAILAFGAVRPQPWVHEGAVVPRQVTTLGLSFDHRIVDGQLGSEFLSDIARQLEDPALALAWS